MGAGFFILILIGLLILLVSPISYLVLKKLGYKQIGIILSVFLALIVLIPTTLFIFESELYFKSDAKEDLKILNIKLTDNFKILSNEIIGTVDYYQTTCLKISVRDNERIIKEITSSSNFTTIDSVDKSIIQHITKYTTLDKTWNYTKENYFIREFYQKTAGYSPLEMEIRLKNNSDTLILYKIMD